MSVNTYECKFAVTMQLPCRHMFAVRNKRNVPLHCEDAIAHRWQLTYLRNVFHSKNNTTIHESYHVS